MGFTPLSRSGWVASSNDASVGAASNAIDGNVSTFWSNNGSTLPVWLILDMCPVTTLSRSGWSILSVDSTASGFPASNMLDGNASSIWSSSGGGSGYIALDFGSGFSGSYDTLVMQNRSDASGIGSPNSFSVYVSNDGVTWGSPIGTFTGLNQTPGAINSYSLGGTYTNRYLKIQVASVYGVSNIVLAEIWIGVIASTPTFNAITYLPRQDNKDWAGSIEIYVSTDGVTWGSTVATATWPGDWALKTLTFASQTKRYLKFNIVSIASGARGFQGACEFNVGTWATPTQPPVTSGLEVWLDAGQGIGLPDGTSLMGWADSSGNQNDINFNVGGSKAVFRTNQINGLPAVDFSAAAVEYLFDTAIAATGAYTVFAVWKLTSTSKGTLVSGAAGLKYFLASTQGIDKSRIVQIGLGTTSLSTTGWHHSNVVYTNNSTSLTFRLDAAADPTNLTGAANITGSITDFGIDESHSEQFTGIIAELLLYGRALSGTEVTQVESYLGTKYALAGAAPTTFGNRVTQDAKEVLYVPSPSARVTQVAKEVLHLPSPRARVTQLAKEALWRLTPDWTGPDILAAALAEAASLAKRDTPGDTGRETLAAALTAVAVLKGTNPAGVDTFAAAIASTVLTLTINAVPPPPGVTPINCLLSDTAGSPPVPDFSVPNSVY